MSLIFDPGVTRYGTFTFPVETVTTGISVVPVPDQAGRTIIYNKYTFTIETWLTGIATDARVRAIVQQLTKTAFPFVYSGRGLGVSVNVGKVRDAVWGPTPVSCEVVPLGAGNGVKLVWKVEVHLPDCADAVYQFAMMEFNYGLTYSIDASGYTTRTHKGHVRIPMTRTAGARALPPDSADFYREQINPPMLLGFRRIPGEFNLSMDRARLDFTITDEQLPPNVPPPGIILCSAEHSVSCSATNWVTWNHTLSATYEIAIGGGATVAAAREAFFRLLQDRVGFTIAEITRLRVGATPPGGGVGAVAAAVVVGAAAGGLAGGLAGATAGGVAGGLIGFGIGGPLGAAIGVPLGIAGGGVAGAVGGAVAGGLIGGTLALIAPSPAPVLATVMRGEFHMSEPEIYGKTKCHYSCSWSVIGAELADMLLISGLWRPTPDSDWPSWSRSIATTVGSRGHAGLIMRLEDDAIVDLCKPAPKFPVLTTGGAGTRGASDGMARAAAVARAGNAGPGGSSNRLDNTDIFPKPTLAKSWLSWYDSFTVEVNNNVVPVVTLSVNPPDERNDLFGSGKGTQVSPVDGPGGDVQRRKQSAYLIYEGTASRLGFPVPCPTLVKWGNVKLVPANRKDHGEGFTSGVVANAGYGVYAARWKLRFWVPSFDA